ncbi:MAG TPA: phosphoribosylamine--glycine ligase family protein, partial [Verrucomicrobiales bacterium]|nr:phosphoribosylamine--glycine ligase family protein [Verrucomicrobiales bacterium]
MKVLVVGKGGREHALITALHESPGQPELLSFPGSDAIGLLARRVSANGVDDLVEVMKREAVDLCVAGEESYLVTGAGLANLCQAAGIPCWGPHLESA